MACSAYCGRCRPALLVALQCPRCNQTTDFTRDECLYFLGYPHRISPAEKRLRESGAPRSPHCRICGADLMTGLKEEVLPMDCRYSGIVCGYPCGKHVKERAVGDLPCEKQVPLGLIGTMPDVVAEATRREKAVARKVKRSLSGAKRGPGQNARTKR